MDQFVSLFGQPNEALFLDCRSLATEAIPLPLADAGLALVVCDSGVKHAIAVRIAHAYLYSSVSG